MCVCGGDGVCTRVFSAVDIIITQEQCCSLCSNILVLVGLLSWAVLFVGPAVLFTEGRTYVLLK